jgi:hypothetical protein
MAASCVITVADEKHYKTGMIRKIKWVCTADSAGALTNAVSKTAEQWTGWVSRFVTVPGTCSGYTIALKDDLGISLASKSGASTTLPEDHVAGYHICESTLELAVTGAGSGGTFTAYAWIVSP